MVDVHWSVCGVSSSPICYEVGTGIVRACVEAVGDSAPIYDDETAAQAASFRPRVAPPTFLGTLRPQALPDLQLAVVHQYDQDSLHWLDCEIAAKHQHGDTCGIGTAIVALPTRA